MSQIFTKMSQIFRILYVCLLKIDLLGALKSPILLTYNKLQVRRQFKPIPGLTRAHAK